MKTANFVLIVLLSTLCCAAAQARDAFDKVQCGGDVRAALVGGTLPDGTGVSIEQHHTAIQLKNLGSDEASDNFDMVSWSMCGGEYELLVDHKQVVRDAIAFPPHSHREPEFSGIECKLNNRDDPSYIVALLDNKSGADAPAGNRYGPGDSTLLPAEQAWKIDEKHAKFVKLDAATLSCPRAGIITLDGGA